MHHNIGPAYMGALFNKVDRLYHSRSSKSLQQGRFNKVSWNLGHYAPSSDVWRNSFSSQSVKDWNVLDNVIKYRAPLKGF